MKICILSKPEHARPHAEALRERGHEVDVVDPKGSYPLSYDVYVCRIESVSHQASWDMADLRRTGKTVIFENSKTRILAAVAKLTEDDVMTIKNLETLTIERKINTTIRALGVYSPRVSFSDHQIEGLAKLGLVKDVELAKNCVRVMRGLNNNSLANPWTMALANEATYKSFPCYKTTSTGGRIPIKLLSVENLPRQTVVEATRILGVDLQGTPRQLQPLPPVPSPKVEAPVVEAKSEIKPETKLEIVEEIKPEPLPPEPEVKIETPPPVETKPDVKAANPKADVKELLSMLNDTLLALNIASLSIVPDKAGPKIELSQVVVRKVTSVDDLE